MEDDDKLAFMLYSCVVSFQFHPGVDVRLTPMEACSLTLEYFYKFKRFREEGVWRGSDRQSELGRV